MSINRYCNGVFLTMGCCFLMIFCAKGNDLFSSEWLRNYQCNFNPSSVSIVVDKAQRAVSIKNRSGVILVQFLLPKCNKLQDIIVNQKNTKALVFLSARETSSGLKDSINFVGKDGVTCSLPTEIGGDEGRIFISELGSISKTGRYLLAQCGIYSKRESGFTVVYQWKVLDLFSKCNIVGSGIDSWSQFIET